MISCERAVLVCRVSQETVGRHASILPVGTLLERLRERWV